MENKTVVKKPNRMILAGQKLTPRQSKIIYSILAQFRFSLGCDKVQEKFIVKFRDIDPNFINHHGGNLYELAKNEAKNLVQQYLSLKEYDNAGKEIIVFLPLVKRVEVHPSSSEIVVVLDDYMLNLLKEMIETGYTKIAFKDIYMLSSSYSIRLYEIITRYKTMHDNYKKDDFVISVEELRYLLGIDENKYYRFQNFKDRVLRPARKEITNKTPLRFDYDYIASGRKIVKIHFKNISYENIDVLAPIDSDKPLQEHNRTKKLEKALTYLDSKTRKDVLSKYSNDYILHYYKKAKAFEKTGKLKSSFSGLFYTYLKKDNDEYEENKKTLKKRVKTRSEDYFKRISERDREQKRLKVEFRKIVEDYEKQPDAVKKIVREQKKKGSYLFLDDAVVWSQIRNKIQFDDKFNAWVYQEEM